METCIHDSIGRWSEWGDSFAFSSQREENRGVAAVETGGKQGSTGALHLDGSEELHALLSRKDRPTAFVVSDDIQIGRAHV